MSQYARALNKCNEELQANLNLDKILPCLCTIELLSNDDMAKLDDFRKLKKSKVYCQQKEEDGGLSLQIA